MARITRDACNARRGSIGLKTRTVTSEYSFELSAGQTKDTSSPFLIEVRKLSKGLLEQFTKVNFEKLSWLLKLEILEKCCTNNFHELCEGMISLLYFGLLSPYGKRNTRIDVIFQHFIDKYFECYDILDFNKFIYYVDIKYQKSSFASVLLLFSHYKPLLETCNSLHILKWGKHLEVAPLWLRQALSYPLNTYVEFCGILHQSLHGNVTVDLEQQPYNKATLAFLEANQIYRAGEYSKSLDHLGSIAVEHCGTFLRSWIALISGLNYEHLGKPHSALASYKAALNHYEGCFHALYYSARIFKENGSATAHLECIKLLTMVDVEDQLVDTSLQKILISSHLCQPRNLKLTSLWLLTLSFTFYEKWDEARDTSQSLLTQLTENMNSNSLKKIDCPLSLIAEKDEIPDLPDKSFILMIYVASLLSLKEYQDVDQMLNNNEDYIKLLHDSEGIPKDKLNRYASVLCLLMWSEALYHLSQPQKVLSNYTRLLTMVETFYENEKSWKILLFSLKRYLYKLISLFYRKELKMFDNSVHFARLEDHCCVLAKAEEPGEERNQDQQLLLLIMNRRAELLM